MALALPTASDVAVLKAHVTDNSSAHVAQQQQQQQQQTTQTCDRSSKASADDEESAAELVNAAEAVLVDIETCCRTFQSADGPIYSPLRFVSQSLPMLVELRERSSRDLHLLEKEGKEHGLAFGSQHARRAFLQFVDAGAAVAQWTLLGLQIAEGSSERTAASVGGAAEVHDVSSVYTGFHENSLLFFVPECTTFDPRIQRRIVAPAYMTALRDHLRELLKEILRLQSIEGTLRQQRQHLSAPGAAPAIVAQQRHSAALPSLFVPSIAQFQFLYLSLQLYYSYSIIEEEQTTLTYFTILQEKLQQDAVAIADELGKLPKPILVPPLGRNLPRSVAGDVEFDDGLREPQREQLAQAFSHFDGIRQRAAEIQQSLRDDIAAKNHTHVTRVAQGKAANASANGTPLAAPTTRPTAEATRASSWWGTMKEVSSRLVKGVGDVVTCKAEVFGGSGDTDADGVPLTKTSPLCADKEALLGKVDGLVKALDALADGLEQQFPTYYHRDWKSRVSKTAAKALKVLESMTVVFKQEEPPAREQ